MSIIKVPVLYAGSKGDKHLLTLFDSGAHLSCIDPQFIKDLEIPVPLGRVRRLETASIGHYIEVRDAVRLDFYIDDIQLSDEFLVVPGLREEAIIGVATMQKWRMKLDFEHDRVIVDRRLATLRLMKCA
jgi:hypothetical protein